MFRYCPACQCCCKNGDNSVSCPGDIRYLIGAIDWNVRNFHGYTYTTHRGTTYNAYLILDEKVALVDTVKREFTEEMLDRIRELVDPSEIEVIVANHGEKDHSGAIPAVLDLAPKAKLVKVKSYDKAIELLSKGNVNALIADYPYCAFTAFRYRDKGLIAGQAQLTFEPLGIAVPEDTLLINLLQNFLATLNGTGQLKKLNERWLKDGSWIKELP